VNENSLARAKAEQVLEIIDGVQDPIRRFDTNDARWCLKLLAEAIIAELPDTAYPSDS